MSDSEMLRSSIHLKSDEKIDENLLCSICSELAIDPQECEDC